MRKAAISGPRLPTDMAFADVLSGEAGGRLDMVAARPASPPAPTTIKGTDAADALSGGGGDDAIYGYAGKSSSPDAGAIRAVLVGSGFDGAVFASSAPGDPDRLYVVTKDDGEIRILDPATGSTSLFLDIPDSELSGGGEEGLLGLAFHPDYAANGRFFVHLVNADGDVEIREYARSEGNPNAADPDPVRTVITVPHPDFGNHNGGAMAFGPNDGYLYIALGDGGGANDPDGNAQNLGVLLGKILRLDIDHDDFPSASRNYAIPDDNPFVAGSGADEIWACGLRNPWRVAFDENGDLYIGDVGQNEREEIDFQPAGSQGGENYGWDLAEGTLGDPPPGSVLPVFEYSHEIGDAVTGGHVYRGDGPALYGAYFFADFVTDRVWTLEGGHATERTAQIVSADAPLGQISSFGIDGGGELYAVSLSGNIFRLDLPKYSGDLGDTLRGRGGDDRLFGGPGNDTLTGGNNRDRLSGGLGDDALNGSRGRDRMRGDAGDDRMNGGAGNDRMKGGAGADTFVFDTAPDAKSNNDRIADFDGSADRIALDGAIFAAIGAALSDDEFHAGAAAAAAGHRIVYNPDNGALIYDANGAAAGGDTRFASLDQGLALEAGDFLIA
jgi:glucose/arabinose dehydrogenase